MSENKKYLGDGVYVEIDRPGTGIILTTSNGIEDTNTIVLENEVLANLTEYVRRNRDKLEVD